MRTLFRELEEIRPFELLKSSADRVHYLVTKQAKIVAMTCTHAALKRRWAAGVVAVLWSWLFCFVVPAGFCGPGCVVLAACQSVRRQQRWRASP